MSAVTAGRVVAPASARPSVLNSAVGTVPELVAAATAARDASIVARDAATALADRARADRDVTTAAAAPLAGYLADAKAARDTAVAAAAPLAGYLAETKTARDATLAASAVANLRIHRGDPAVVLPGSASGETYWVPTPGALTLYVNNSGAPAQAVANGKAVVFPLREALDAVEALMVKMSPASGWLTATYDKKTGRISSGVRANGKPFVAGASSLDPALSKKIFKERSTVKSVEPDLIQSTRQGLGVMTCRGAGYAWRRLPFLKGARYLESATYPGTGLQFRKRLAVNMPGIRYLGDWSPGAAPSTKQVGTLSNTPHYGYRNSSPPSAASYSDGDYWVVYPIGGGTIDFSDVGLGIGYPGDLVVRKDGAWVLVRAPAGTASAGTVTRQDWWNVSADGVFAGVSYKAGDRIIMHGGTYYHRYRRGRPDLGEKFLRGELDASPGVAPLVPVAGDIWQVSVAGTVSGLVLGVDDWVLYDGTKFYSVPTTPIQSVANSSPFLIRLDGDPSEYEVRRTDKSSSQFPVRLYAQGQVATRVDTSAVVAVGDSMMHFLLSAITSAYSDREIKAEGYDSADAIEIASMFEHYVTQEGNPFLGRTVVAWYGQNNENDWQLTIEAHLRMRQLAASFDAYYLPVIPIGRREMTFNGTRLVGMWQEPMKVGTDTTNGLVMQQGEIRRLFGGRCVDARQAVIDMVAANASLFSGPDKQFPGMTEAQTAAAYGLVPCSCYRNSSTYNAATNFVGYWSGGLVAPTGGAPGDYYIRTVDGNYDVGNLIVNVNGTWTEDGTANRNSVVHLSMALANTAVAQAIRAATDLYGW